MDLTPLKVESEPDAKAPAYLIGDTDTYAGNDTHRGRVKRARLFYRSFTPSEDARLSAIDAIRHVSKSIGVLWYLSYLLSSKMQTSTTSERRSSLVSRTAWERLH